jgi:deoxycytidine triphosphate deaminase
LRYGPATAAACFRRSWSRRPERRAPGGQPMSIKSDNWIRRMAREQRMIEPFEPGQVREANGQRIVSYGTSSYGYDVRCADEFKIFTNINSTIVDPKKFDEKSFVDFRGDVCIIPPNSFALARTVEYFRVPRNVLIITVGKSTFARCGVIVKVTSRSSFPTRHRCPRKYMPTRASHRCCSSSPTKYVRPRTRTAAASIRDSAASRCRRPERGAHRDRSSLALESLDLHGPLHLVTALLLHPHRDVAAIRGAPVAIHVP